MPPPQKLNQAIINNLHVKKQSIQLIDYTKLFNKKFNVPIDTDIHADIICKIKNRRNGTFNRITFELSYLKIHCGFEGSNISFAHAEGNEVFILLNADTNSNGCTHWFYFKVQSTEDKEFKFKILNNRRNGSLIGRANHIHSRETDSEWKQNTFGVFYYKTNINHPYYHNIDTAIIQQNVEFYTLEFCIKLHANVETDIALNRPYIVSNLQRFLNSVRVLKSHRIKVIHKTPTLDLPIYKISFKPQQQRVTESIVIISRQHPSETVGSFLCEFLLRELFEDYNLPYKMVVFPMLNPDGVYLGNSRCNFFGVDLNRKWENMDHNSASEIVAVKSYLKKLHQKYPILFTLDLHGHSQQLNSCLYGCMPNGTNSVQDYVLGKLFVRIMDQNCRYFSYPMSRFRVQKNKRSTARVTFFREFHVKNSYTIETSYFGHQGDPQPVKYADEQYQEMARAIIKSLEMYKYRYQYFKSIFETNQSKKEKMQEIELFPMAELENVQQNLNKGVDPIQLEQLPDSDSEAECDIKTLPRHKKKRVLSQDPTRANKRYSTYERFLESQQVTETSSIVKEKVVRSVKQIPDDQLKKFVIQNSCTKQKNTTESLFSMSQQDEPQSRQEKRRIVSVYQPIVQIQYYRDQQNTDEVQLSRQPIRSQPIGDFSVKRSKIKYIRPALMVNINQQTIYQQFKASQMNSQLPDVKQFNSKYQRSQSYFERCSPIIRGSNVQHNYDNDFYKNTKIDAKAVLSKVLKTIKLNIHQIQ